MLLIPVTVIVVSLGVATTGVARGRANPKTEVIVVGKSSSTFNLRQKFTTDYNGHAGCPNLSPSTLGQCAYHTNVSGASLWINGPFQLSWHPTSGATKTTNACLYAKDGSYCKATLSFPLSNGKLWWFNASDYTRSPTAVLTGT